MIFKCLESMNLPRRPKVRRVLSHKQKMACRVRAAIENPCCVCSSIYDILLQTFSGVVGDLLERWIGTTQNQIKLTGKILARKTDRENRLN